MIAIITKEDFITAVEAIADVAYMHPLPDKIAVRTDLILEDVEEEEPVH